MKREEMLFLICCEVHTIWSAAAGDYMMAVICYLAVSQVHLMISVSSCARRSAPQVRHLIWIEKCWCWNNTPWAREMMSYTSSSFLVGQSGCNGNSWARIDHTCITAMLLCTHGRHFLFSWSCGLRYYIESMEKKEKKKTSSNFFLFVFYIYVSHIYFAVSSYSFLLGSFPTRLSALPQLLLPDSLLYK